MTIHKGRSCCRNGIFLSVQLISPFKNYHCSELGFSPYLLGFFLSLIPMATWFPHQQNIYRYFKHYFLALVL